MFRKLRSDLFIACCKFLICQSYVWFRCRLFRRILWTVVCRMCNFTLALEIEFFRLRTKACLTRSTSPRPLIKMPFLKLPPPNCSCHLLMHLSSGDLTPYSCLNSHWTRWRDWNFPCHNPVCPYCSTADIVQLAHNMHLKLLPVNCSWDACATRVSKTVWVYS
jgi:hypothetical protein